MTDRSKNVEEVLAPGTRIEEFVIERALQSGGFGVTYLAEDRSLGRRVAIKEYLPREWGARRADGSVGPRSSSFEEDYRWGLTRFLEEARTLARLDHARIVRVHRVIEAWGTAYMVMEHVEGRNLEETLQAEGPWPEARVRGVLEALLPGVELVHGAGLIHRDVKPANVMLRADGTPVLIDFGAARYAAGVHSRSLTSVLTPGYAPHEQYHQTAGKQGPWTDVYALGAVAYRALSGRKPVEAPARVESAARKQADPLTPLTQAAAGEVSAGFGAAVTSALALWPEGRPRDVSTWRAQWDAGAAPAPSPSPSPARPVPSPPRREGDDSHAAGQGQLAALVAFLVLVATGAVGLLVTGQRAASSSGGRVADLSPEAGLSPGEDDAIRRAVTEEEAERQRLAAEAQADAEAAEAARRSAEEAERQRLAAEARADAEAVAAARREAEAADVPRPDPPAPAPARPDPSRPVRRAGEVFGDCPSCPEMVVVPAGTFRMGSPASEQNRRDTEGPQRRVTLRSFALGVTEVTFDEWEACVRGGGCGGYRPGDEGWGRGTRPVINVNWDDARTYVSWLSAETGAVYRLPSESEWEYAARAGSTTPFHTGATISMDQANYDGNYVYGSGRRGTSRGRTTPVGTFAPNPFGLYDVHGNVWEWVEDCWHGSYRGAPSDGRAWTVGGDCGRRVLRGGSWLYAPRYLRSAARSGGSTGLRRSLAGFRVARTLD